MAIGLDEVGFVWEQFGCDIPHFIFRVSVVSHSYRQDYGMKRFASTRHGIYAKLSPVGASQGFLNWYEPYILLGQSGHDRFECHQGETPCSGHPNGAA